MHNNTLRGRLYAPSSNMTRGLSLDLGGGNCKWQPPAYEVPDSIDFKKTIIAGFPSGDKRMIFVQMEALTGWRELSCCVLLYQIFFPVVIVNFELFFLS